VASDVSLVSEDAAGNPLFAVVHVQLERHAQQSADLLRRHLLESDNVQFCLDISGTFDMLLMVVTSDMDAYNKLADTLLMQQPAVRRFETSFIKKRAKVTLALPLEELTRGR
jgi:Lrp/AsnC family leucine-responsive transcriptional regulator